MGKVAHYFVTLQCNASCEFCPCWQGTSEQGNRREEYPGREWLLGLKQAGVTLLNLTGGEPLLSNDLPKVMRDAKESGLRAKLVTNGILYAERARELRGLSDLLFFSLDYPFAEMHDRSRGVECFHEVVKGIRLARELGERPLIKFTLTRDSVLYLPEMSELAAKLGVYLYLNPVYDFSGTQGFEPATFAHIRYYGRKRHVLLDLAALEFVREKGNRVLTPRCRARETTLTILPDGSRVGPCFFNQGGRQGREDVCSSCMRWPYVLPSFSQGMDKYFWLHGYSGWVNRRKGVEL